MRSSVWGRGFRALRGTRRRRPGTRRTVKAGLSPNPPTTRGRWRPARHGLDSGKSRTDPSSLGRSTPAAPGWCPACRSSTRRSNPRSTRPRTPSAAETTGSRSQIPAIRADPLSSAPGDKSPANRRIVLRSARAICSRRSSVRSRLAPLQKVLQNRQVCRFAGLQVSVSVLRLSRLRRTRRRAPLRWLRRTFEPLRLGDSPMCGGRLRRRICSSRSAGQHGGTSRQKGTR
jgi:hypothetical protein